MTAAHLAGTSSQTASGGSGRHWLALAAYEALLAEGDGREASGFAACGLGGDARTVSEARHFTRSTLSGWGMGALVDDVSVIVSELLSNALRYGLGGGRGDAPDGDRIWLGLLRRGDTVLCAVCDPGPEVPVLREPDHFAESGRGLHVIDSLSDSWGWTTPDGAGKAVWAAVSA